MVCKSFDYIAEPSEKLSVETYVLFPDKIKRTQRKLTKVGGGEAEEGNGEAVKMRKTTQEFAIHEKRRRRRPCVSHRMRDLI